MRHKKLLLLTAALLVGFLIAQPRAHAQAAALVGLHEYLGAVAEKNLDLQAQFETLVAARAGLTIAGVRPDPQFTGGIASKELNSANKASAATALTAGISWTLETGGKRDARLHAAQSTVKLTEANVAAFKRQLEVEASAAFIDACRARAVLARKESSLTAMREVVRANEVRFKAGDIGRLELSQSKVEADRFQADVTLARADAAAADLSLANFLGERREQRFANRTLDCTWSAGDAPASADKLVAQARDARDDVQQARATVDNARDGVELARANRAVDPTLNVGLTNTPRVNPVLNSVGNVMNSPAQHSLALNLTFSVPIPLSRMQGGELVQAESALTQAQLQLGAVLLKAETDVRVAHAQYGASAGNVQIYTEHVLDDAQHVLDGTRTSYRRGSASLLELLSAQRTADEVYLAYLQAVADRAKARIRLQQSAGQRLEL